MCEGEECHPDEAVRDEKVQLPNEPSDCERASFELGISQGPEAESRWRRSAVKIVAYGTKYTLCTIVLRRVIRGASSIISVAS